MLRTIQFIVCIGFVLISTSLLSQHVVINEVYGGGGNSGSVYKNDFIELFNPTTSAVNLAGWSVQYASATGTGAWTVTPLSGTIEPGGYYLIQEATGTNGTTDLPTPDATGSIALAAGAGKVALVSSTIALSGQCPPINVIDLVGFGTTANCFEGSGRTSAPSNTASVERKIPGVDTDDNSSDFQISTFPNPQNKIAEFTMHYPKLQSVTSTDLEIVTSLNKTAITYFVILPLGSLTPLSVQVKNGQDASGSPIAPNLKGFVQVTVPSSDMVIPVTGLIAATSYDVYVVAENAGGLQSVPVKLQATTVDPFAPNLSLSTTSIGFPGFTDKDKQSASDIYTIAASNLSEDVLVVVSGNYVISKNDVDFANSLIFAASDFTADQAVYVRFNPSGNISSQSGTITHSSTGVLNKQISLTAISIDPYHQNFNDPSFLTNSGWTQYNKTGVQTWASTNFGHTCLTGCNAGTPDKGVQINGFASSAVANEDWLISPKLDLADYSDFAAMSFWTISAFSGEVVQLRYSIDYSGSGDPTLATWIPLDGKFPPANSNLWTESSNVLLPKQDNIHVAFIYISTTAAASRWTIDDWKVEDVAGYLNVPNFNFSFGEIASGSISTSQSFIFEAQGFGNIELTTVQGYELSTDNILFSSSLTVNEQNASIGKTIYVRFVPDVKQLKWPGAIYFTGGNLSQIAKGALSGSSYPLTETFDITTYNLEFFGTDVRDAEGDEFGPADDVLQIDNVTSVLQTIKSDIIAVEEVSDDNAMNQLVGSLPGYEKIMSNRWSYSFDPPDPDFPPQKIGFVFNMETVELIESRVMFAEMYENIRTGQVTLPGYPGAGSNSFWSSGRLPFMATVNVTLNDLTKQIKLIVLHSKSGSASADYERRKYDVKVLYDSLIAHYPNDAVIILGDFNDDVDESINTGSSSTYKIFVDDHVNFKVLTHELSQNGGASFPSSGSFLDHVIISNELFESYISNSIAIEDPRLYISNYSSTTSDHLPVSARFAIKGDQQITFDLNSQLTYTSVPFELRATSSSGLSVNYISSDPSVVSIQGNIATILNTGRAIITASQAGNESYDPALNVVRELVIDKATQHITFTLDSPIDYSNVPFELNAISSSALEVRYSSSDPAIVSINENKAVIHKAGTVKITAHQEGDDFYNAAADVSVELVINKLVQMITFAVASPITYGDQSVELTATCSSGLPVNYSSSNSTIVEIDGNRALILKAGTVLITSSQPGNEWYEAAADVEMELIINKADQTITFSAIEERLVDENSFSLFASSNAGLPITFFSDSDKVIIENDEVSLINPGRVTITAIQAGNSDYNEATATRSFCIRPLKPSITILNSGSELPLFISSSSNGNQWYHDDVAIKSETNATYTATLSGVFKVQVTIDDCISDFSDDVPIVVTDLPRERTVSFYPNPATDYLILSGIESHIITAVISDTNGRSLLLSYKWIADERLQVDINSLSKGMYILKLVGNEFFYQVRFIKN